MKRIVCVGNRYIRQDAAGPLVHDWIARSAPPCDVEVLDGGLAGLDLLRFLPGAERVVFVDALTGDDGPDGVFILDVDDVARQAGAAYDHSAGLAYLLRVLPRVCEGTIPEILLVGIRGTPDQSTIAAAAELSVTIAVEGYAEERWPRAGSAGVRA